MFKSLEAPIEILYRLLLSLKVYFDKLYTNYCNIVIFSEYEWYKYNIFREQEMGMRALHVYMIAMTIRVYDTPFFSAFFF